ncbi:hypothetical protein TeGR_g4288 [Tetraparma gracilis]|uniref:EF-hand domain-containing protein n=1 Tax=Tetraparma gracilis TaxID=2962635 RepID=A0ABQ6N3W2_9STRA|nr:hypothetical protein TeGR_g4288 [Tetraparma gracilis]
MDYENFKTERDQKRKTLKKNKSKDKAEFKKVDGKNGESQHKGKGFKDGEDRYDTQRKMSLASVPVLSFAQFSMAVWLLTHYELATLSFNMFDVDGSGNLDIDEVKKIVSKVYSNSSPAHGGAMVAADGHTAQVGTPVDERAMQILEGMDVDGNGDVSKAEYCAMVKKYHYMLMPAFVLQKTVRDKIFGHYADWAAIELERQKNDHITVVDIVTKIDKSIKEHNAKAKLDGGASLKKLVLEEEEKKGDAEEFSIKHVASGAVQNTIDTDAKKGVMIGAEYKVVAKQAAESRDMAEKHRALDRQDRR